MRAKRRAIVQPLVSLLASVALLGACRTESRVPELRLWTDDLSLRVSANPTPPAAREDVIYKVVVRDKRTNRPIEGGEGQIFATSRDSTSVWDSFRPGD